MEISLEIETVAAAQKRPSQCPSPSLANLDPLMLAKRASSCPSAFSLFSAGGPTPYLRLVSWTCSLGGLLFGYASSSINDSIPFMRRELDLTPAGVGLVTSCFMVGAALGGLIGGRLADRFGRKRTLVLCDGLFIAGTFFTSFAPTLELILPARMLLGFASGGITSAAPVLLAEISTAEYRSQNVTLSLLVLVLGELCVFVVGAVLGNIWYETPSIWRWMNLVVALPAILLLGCHALLVPESPRWLAQQGQPQRAWAILRKMRRTSAQTRNELREIDAVVGDATAEGADEQTNSASIGDILTVPWLRRVLLIGIGIAITQQAYGVAIGMLFGTEVLREAGLDTKLALVGNIAIGLVSFLASWAGLLLVSRMGRRPLLMIGQVGAICMHVLIVICSAVLPQGVARGWTTLGLLLPFLVFSQGCISTVTWLMAAEIFPLSMRGVGTGICMLAAWSSACAVGQLFPISVHHFGQAWTFSGFVVLGLISLVFVWQFLPETRNKTLEELEQQFQASDWPALKRAGQSSEERRKKRDRQRALSTVKELDKY